MTPLLRLRLGATGTLLAGAALASVMVGVFSSPWPLRWGVFLAVGLALPSYWVLSLTLRLSNAHFFGAFVAGMLVRWVGLGVGAGWVWRESPGSLTAFALSTVAGLVGFSFMELFFIGRQNRLPL